MSDQNNDINVESIVKEIVANQEDNVDIELRIEALLNQNQDTNIEEIMREIREEIKERGYTNDLISFEDIIVDTSGMNATKFDKNIFDDQLHLINSKWNIQAYRTFTGSKISIFVKKVIRKLVYFFVEPIVLEQDDFNGSLVRLMNQMNCYIDENEKLKKEVEVLTKKINDLYCK